MKEQTEKVDLNRRNFLKGGSMASVMAVMASGKDVLQPSPSLARWFAVDDPLESLIGIRTGFQGS